MNFAIIIPARKGSKGIKNKNLIRLKNKSLANYTFETIKDLKFKKYLITDDLKLKKVSKKYNISSEYIRPKIFSKDDTPIVETLMDFFKWLRLKDVKIDAFIMLQLTSPLRTKKDILNAIKKYKKNNFKSLFSVSASQEHPYETINLINENKFKLTISKSIKFFRRQDYDVNSYFINGAIYITDLRYFLSKKKLVSNKHGVSIMSKCNSFDIDDKEDLEIVKKFI